MMVLINGNVSVGITVSIFAPQKKVPRLLLFCILYRTISSELFRTEETNGMVIRLVCQTYLGGRHVLRRGSPLRSMKSNVEE
jgi:hypothetical protein